LVNDTIFTYHASNTKFHLKHSDVIEQYQFHNKNSAHSAQYPCFVAKFLLKSMH